MNNYAGSLKRGVARTVKGLAKGKHTIQVRVLGKKGSKKGKGTLVAIDGFKVGKTVTTTPALTKVSWQSVPSAPATNGSYTVADLKGQSMKFSVRGTGVTVTSARGPGFGKVGVYVDGTLRTTADLYAKSLTYGYGVSVNGLSDGVHSVVVKVLGSKNSKSTGTGVLVDQVDVS